MCHLGKSGGTIKCGHAHFPSCNHASMLFLVRPDSRIKEALIHQMPGPGEEEYWKQQQLEMSV